MPAHPEENVMAGKTRFLDCPAYLGNDGAARCGLPAEIEARYIMRSTDGPLESARIWCPRGHRFNGPIQALTAPGQPPAGAAVSASPLAPPYRYWWPS
jgi:hypothetical protein